MLETIFSSFLNIPLIPLTIDAIIENPENIKKSLNQ